jgi:D-alanine-D-alanine ligase
MAFLDPVQTPAVALQDLTQLPAGEGPRAVVAEVPDGLRARLQKVAVEAYRALRVRDYGRIDLRLAEDGEIYVIEVNASCYLEKSGEFATAAAAAGLDYVKLINRIAELALERRTGGVPEARRRHTGRKPRREKMAAGT